MKRRPPRTPPTTGGPCHFCGKTAGVDDWCYGCGVYVCQGCERALGTGDNAKPDHDPSTHLHPNVDLN